MSAHTNPKKTNRRSRSQNAPDKKENKNKSVKINAGVQSMCGHMENTNIYLGIWKYHTRLGILIVGYIFYIKLCNLEKQKTILDGTDF